MLRHIDEIFIEVFGYASWGWLDELTWLSRLTSDDTYICGTPQVAPRAYWDVWPPEPLTSNQTYLNWLWNFNVWMLHEKLPSQYYLYACVLTFGPATSKQPQQHSPLGALTHSICSANKFPSLLYPHLSPQKIPTVLETLVIANSNQPKTYARKGTLHIYASKKMSQCPFRCMR